MVPACLAAGAAWLRAADAAVARLPSAVVPLADNVLINPAHPDAGRCVVAELIPYAFEPRLLDARSR